MVAELDDLQTLLAVLGEIDVGALYASTHLFLDGTSAAPLIFLYQNSDQMAREYSMLVVPANFQEATIYLSKSIPHSECEST